MKRTPKRKLRNCIGPRIKEARLKAVPIVTQEDLAGKLAGMGYLLDRSAISRIESQDRSVTDLEIVAIAKLLKISVAWLFDK